MILRMPFRKFPTFFLEGMMNSFPLGYLRTFCPRKSKPVLHVRNDGLCRREFKTSFLQELLDQGLDFLLPVILSIYW